MSKASLRLNPKRQIKQESAEAQRAHWVGGEKRKTILFYLFRVFFSASLRTPVQFFLSRHLLTFTLLMITGLLSLVFFSDLRAADKDWPMFRENAAQTGVIATPLAERYALAWTYATGGACTSAVVSDGLAVVGSGDGKIHAVDVITGKAKWTTDLAAQIDAAPLILDGAIIIGSTEGRLVSLTLSEGKIRWETKAGDKIVGAANWFLHNGIKKIIVGSYDSKVHCFNAADGVEVWSYETGSYVNGTPAIAMVGDKQVAVAGGCDAKLHIINLADGTKLHEIPVSAYIAASVAVADGRAYVGDYGNEVTCTDLTTGTAVWTYKDRNFPFFSSPAVSADMVVLGGRDRRVHGVDRVTGKARWVFSARGNVDGSPLISGNRVMIGSDDGRLYLLDLADGKERWSYELGDKLSGAPAFADGHIFVGGDDGHLYKFAPVN